MREKNKILYLIKIARSYSAKNFKLSLMLTIVEGLMVPFMLFTVAKFIDAAMTITSSNPKIMTMAVYLGMTVLSYLYMQVGQDFRQYSYSLLEDDLRRKYKADIIKSQFEIDYLLFEAPKTQDLLLRVTKEIEVKIVKVIHSVNTLVSVLIQLLGVLYVVATVNFWIVFVYIFIMFPTVLLTFKNGRILYEEEKKVGFITRQMNYLSELLTDRETSNERNLFGFAPVMNERFMKAHLFRSNYNTKVLAKETSSSMMVNVVSSVLSGFIIFVLAKEIPSGEISVGMFTSIAGSMLSLSKIVAFQSSELILEFSKHYEYAKDLDEFTKLKRNKLDISEVKNKLAFESLVIKNLWFKYEESEDYILKGLNLSIEKGKSYSLIGLNGAGKSTLVKIMVGLYRDYKGEILLNGKNLKSYSFGELRSIFSVVSQDFAKYYVSLKENISFEDFEADISEVIKLMDLDEVVESLSKKEHSKLGKIYEDGRDLSGGQWQRIAIARALYSNSPFMIMDEPTASLSPTAESMIYNQFLNIANDKTLFMITHRLGSTKITDEIIVLDKGKIIESGTHKELMKNDNIYAKLFRKQGEMYD